ncbi:MAG: SDR family NAD-dependent epimerase/dehydratase, partial [Candidatus Omnitrophica bacterium]|nr:SDR family NAD-dependent epimerase/dehydratase [Candidatus Omnitrophota bacterium]
PRQRKPDISKAKKALKWEPRISLAEGLKKTIPWFNNQP